MNFGSLEEVFEYIRRNAEGLKASDTQPDAEGDSDYCIDCQLDELESKESLLLASVNVNILEVIQNTLNQEAPIRNEQADTLLKLAQVKSILGNC